MLIRLRISSWLLEKNRRRLKANAVGFRKGGKELSNKIDSRAIIGNSVELGDNNIIYPNAYIEDGVVIGSGNIIGPGVVIYKGTVIGDGNKIYAYAVIGDEPQDISYDGAETFVRIGNGNRIREAVTIHRGTKEGTVTVIGNNNFFMGYTHIAHNCKIGNNVVTVNTAVLGGYVEVDDNAFISASVVIHQFCRIGKHVMLSGLSAVNQDVPPYMLCGGRPPLVHTINTVGLRRSGVSPVERKEIKDICKIIFFSGLSLKNALDEVEKKYNSKPAKEIIGFCRSSKRGIVSGGRVSQLKGIREDGSV